MALRFDSYDIKGASPEFLLCIGPEASDRNILILPPSFEELNRLRRTLLLAMRALARRGIGSALPDLPGQNESRVPLAEVTLEDWRAAAKAAAGAYGASHVASLRGGALIDDAPGLPVWRWAPTTGAKLMNVIVRAQVAADKQAGLSRSREHYWKQGENGPVLLGGKTFSPALLAGLRAAEPAAGPNIHENTENLGPPLWLRSEPGESAELAEKLAEALDRWSGQVRA